MGSLPPFELPLVDFGKFLHGAPEERKAAAKELVDSFSNHGFVRLKNHGVSKEFVQQIWDWDRAFFNMSEEAKMKIAHPPSPDPQRGWSRKGLETTSKSRKENLIMAPKNQDELLDEKEHFDCGPWDDAQFPNKFPDEEDLPGFSTFIKSYFDLAQSVSLDIMRACEVGWEMEENSLVSRCIPAASELRLLHYPPVSVKRLQSGAIKRAWPHTDFGIITLLFQDSLGGLECEDRRYRPSTTFVPIVPDNDDNEANELIVNTSDTFTRWTNSEITGGVHQVNVPPTFRGTSAENKGEEIPERYSSVFFLKAHREMSVAPLQHFVRDKQAIYPDITALELHQERTKSLYAIDIEAEGSF